MKLYQTLESQLKKEPNYVSDNGELKKWVVLNKAQNFDEELIELLLDNEELKTQFFIQVKDILVFKQNLFIQFLEQKNYLNDSYTQFKNKVGLSIDGKYLKQRNEVALVWPFKDCVLEGGQSREEDKREEIFFNETLAQDEITELLDPKVLTNAKLFDKDGEKDFNQFNRNENGTITDNLIIKGNNLLALNSLKKEFAGKVKLIYIDPPYNTGNDGFKYNDNFNHSTWLTFMRNRLTIAKELLRDDGAIFISIDQKEIAYLQILLDEIFENRNFKNIITIRRSAISGPKVINPGVVNVSEYLLVYSKSNNWVFNRAYTRRNRDERYGLFIENIEENYQNWRFIPLTEAFVKESGKDIKNLKKELAENWNDEVDRFVIKNIENVIQYANLDENSISGKALEYKVKSKEQKNTVFKLERENKSPYFIVNGKVILFYKDRIREIDGKLTPSEPASDIWLDVLPNDIHNEGGVDFRKGKKPEKFISRIIEIGTNEGEIVLDFHLGSGTTCAVAHKMNRQYIGIEQMNYGKNDSVVRLKKVIDANDDRGISKSVNWQGGGSFIYLELKKYNQTFIEKIEEAENSEALLQIWEEMKSKSFLNYNVDIQKQEQHIEDFKLLTLNEQKQHLCELLNKNQLYVNLSSLNDENFECTAEEKKVTKDFYQLNK